MNRLILALVLIGSACAAPPILPTTDPKAQPAPARRSLVVQNFTLFTPGGGGLGGAVIPNKFFAAVAISGGVTRAEALAWCLVEAPIVSGIPGPWYLAKIHNAEEDRRLNNWLGPMPFWAPLRLWTAGLYDPPFSWDPYYNLFPGAGFPYSNFAPGHPSTSPAGVAFQTKAPHVLDNEGYMYTHVVTDKEAGFLCNVCNPTLPPGPLEDNCEVRPGELFE